MMSITLQLNAGSCQIGYLLLFISVPLHTLYRFLLGNTVLKLL